MLRRYELTDEEWLRIEPLLPPENTGKQGRPRKDNRIIMNGIVWLARSGAPWRDLPERYGSWNNGIQINKAYSGDYLTFKKKCLEKFMKYENG